MTVHEWLTKQASNDHANFLPRFASSSRLGLPFRAGAASVLRGSALVSTRRQQIRRLGIRDYTSTRNRVGPVDRRSSRSHSNIARPAGRSRRSCNLSVRADLADDRLGARTLCGREHDADLGVGDGIAVPAALSPFSTYFSANTVLHRATAVAAQLAYLVPIVPTTARRLLARIRVGRGFCLGQIARQCSRVARRQQVRRPRHS